MLKINFCPLLLTLFFLFGCKCEKDKVDTDWFLMAAPLASSIRDFAEINNKVMFAATTSGIFKSENGGEKWEASGLEGKVIDKILVTKSGVLLAGVYRSGLYRSENQGKSWKLIGFEENVYIYSILESHGKTLFLSASFISEGSRHDTPTGVFKSLDEGKTWEETSLTKPDVMSLCEPKNGLLIASTKSEKFISKNGGESWKTGGVGLPSSIPISDIISINHSLYASLGDRQDETGKIRGGIYRSEDEGMNWFESDTGVDKQSPISSISFQDSIFFASAGFEQKNGYTGIYSSSDTGKTWIKYKLGGSLARFIRRASNGKLIVGTNGQSLFIAEKGERKFTQHGNGINNWETFRITGSKSDLYATGNGIWRYSAEKKCWDLIRKSSSMDVAVTGNGRLLIFEGDRIVASEDKGLSWREIVNIPGDYALFKVISEKLVIASIAGNGSWYSSDQGLTWKKYKLSAGDDFSMRTGMVTERGHIFLSGSNGSPSTFLSTDRGRTFKKIHALDSLEVWDFAILEGEIYAGTYAHGMFKTSDGGVTWRSANTGLKINKEYLTVTSITVVDAKTLLCSTLGSGMLISRDQGNSWKAYNEGLNNENFWTAFYDPVAKEIFAASPSGIYKKKNY